MRELSPTLSVLAWTGIPIPLPNPSCRQIVSATLDTVTLSSSATNPVVQSNMEQRVISTIPLFGISIWRVTQTISSVDHHHHHRDYGVCELFRSVFAEDIGLNIRASVKPLEEKLIITLREGFVV